MPAKISFILNNREVSTSTSPGLLVLDYLRLIEKEMGTKEGCKEGDCGACMVLVGDLDGDKINYLPVTSCLMPVAELQGKHLVTIEGLNQKALSPIQQAVIDEGATQCGFCTPGIVVSITGLLLDETKPVDEEGMKYALSGNLCRCTGYRSLKNGATSLSTLLQQNQTPKSRIEALIDFNIIPDYFQKIPAKLQKLAKQVQRNRKSQVEYWIAGGTDLYFQVGEDVPDAEVIALNLNNNMKGINRKNGNLHIGGLTTFEQFADSAEIQKIIPNIKEFMFLNASWQIRNRATLSGNIINASPIGDMTSLLLAMDVSLVLENGSKSRVILLKEFFKDYKIINKTSDEILTGIILPVPPPSTKINFEKVSKRKTLDIASVNSSIQLHCKNGFIEYASVSMGGVAPVPLFLQETSNFLTAMPVTVDTILSAIDIVQDEISPISDIRGSADYKRLLARQLMIAHFTTLFPENVTVKEFS